MGEYDTYVWDFLNNLGSRFFLLLMYFCFGVVLGLILVHSDIVTGSDGTCRIFSSRFGE